MNRLISLYNKKPFKTLHSLSLSLSTYNTPFFSIALKSNRSTRLSLLSKVYREEKKNKSRSGFDNMNRAKKAKKKENSTLNIHRTNIILLDRFNNHLTRLIHFIFILSWSYQSTYPIYNWSLLLLLISRLFFDIENKS